MQYLGVSYTEGKKHINLASWKLMLRRVFHPGLGEWYQSFTQGKGTDFLEGPDATGQRVMVLNEKMGAFHRMAK